MGRLRANSLRVQLPAAFLMVGLAPVLLFGVVAMQTAPQTLRENVIAQNHALAESVAGEIRRYLDGHVLHLREIALSARLHPDKVGLAEHLLLHVRANPALRSLALLDAEDRVVAVAPPSADFARIDLFALPFVRDARMIGTPTWSPTTMDIGTSEPAAALVIPGSPWTVVGFLDLAELTRIAQHTGLGSATVAAVIDRDGTVIAFRDVRIVRDAVNVRDLDLVARALAGEKQTGGFVFDGQEWLGSAVPIPATGWAVLVMEPAALAFGSMDRLRTLLLAAFAGAIALAAAAGLYSAQRILRPIDALATSTRKLAAGERPSPSAKGALPIEELEELGRLFDSMAGAVRSREEALARSERSYRRLVETPTVGVYRGTADGTLRFANDAMARIVGAPAAEALVGTRADAFYADPRDLAADLAALNDAGRLTNRELRARTLGGEDRILLLNAVQDEDGITAVIVDVTGPRRAAEEKERLEQQLMHSQKLEAVGRLAGGIAHDFNNMLTAIIGYSNVLREELPPGEEGHEAIDGILRAAERAANLTRGLLAYSRKQTLARKPVDLRTVVREAAKLIGRLLGEDVRLTLELGDAPLHVLADAGQFEQVLMNLCTNARDAMPSGGALTLTTDLAAVDGTTAHALGLAPGRFARLRTRDTGTGMAPELAARIFEPFFTTKAAGRGTGLGLSIVHGIVLQHDGAVSVESAPGTGTTVTVLLPEIPEGQVAAEGAEEGLRAAPRGSETVLLAEDEPQVRKVVRSILERSGYQVIEAPDGRAAVEAFAANRDRIALSILDVVMPELNGRQVLEEIRRIAPAARVLFASGYAADVLDARADGPDAPEVLSKPVAPLELLRKVRALLDRG